MIQKYIRRLALFRNLYTVSKMIPIVLFIALFLLGMAIGLSSAWDNTVNPYSLSQSNTIGVIVALFIILMIISWFLSFIFYSFWVGEVSKVALGKKSYIGLNSALCILGYILMFVFSSIPTLFFFSSLFVLCTHIYVCFKSIGVLESVDNKFRMRMRLNIFGAGFGIFFVWLILFLASATDADILSWLLLLMFVLHGMVVILTMNKMQRIIKEKPNLIITVQKKPINKNIDISKITDSITSKDWQYAKNGKLYFIKFNQGSIAEVTSKEEQETKFYNWRINDGSLFCDNPDFEGGGQIINELVQFKNLTLSPVSPSKTVSSTDNK